MSKTFAGLIARVLPGTQNVFVALILISFELIMIVYPICEHMFSMA